MSQRRASAESISPAARAAPSRRQRRRKGRSVTPATRPVTGSERVSPYLGVGGGFLWYELSEAGDFIDFGSESLPIVNTVYFAEGATYELLGLAGVDVQLSPFWSFLVEGRWREADDDVGDDYAGYGALDLSGWELSAGFAFNF